MGVISLLLAWLATLYPSWRASRVNPAEALRYE
jgi:lipoprotein-releasing system permease protein